MPESTAVEVAETLNYGAKTAKRAAWEAWSLKIVDPRKVRVTNESYGCEKDEHRYIVTVEERDGLFVPAECECPADQYNEDYSCKHRVAVATIGGPVVLSAAMAFESDESKPPVRSDGGVVEVDQEAEKDTGEDCGCDDLSGEFPCWPCYRDGRRDLPEGSE